MQQQLRDMQTQLNARFDQVDQKLDIIFGTMVNGFDVLAVGQDQIRAAIDLAKHVAAFPQICMNSDRLSAYRQWDFDIEGALAHEARAGVIPLREGAAAGARRFTEGAGRGGSFAPLRETDC